MRPDGTIPRAGRALLAESIATILSSLCGTSTIVSYIESASGVEAGGRTGLTTVTTSVLMLLALLFTPLILIVPASATAPALVIVGVFMMQSVVEVDMKDFKIAAPVVLTILAIPLTFSIAEGIGLGLNCAALLALALGEPKKMTALGSVSRRFSSPNSFTFGHSADEEPRGNEALREIPKKTQFHNGLVRDESPNAVTSRSIQACQIGSSWYR